MTFDQYINNPMGKGSVANTVAQRDSWKLRYKEKFDQINLREAGKINYFLYYNEKSNIFVIHILIPSEVLKGFYYDTVIEFTSDNSDATISTNLNGYNVKFYSNDPSFVFTYMKVFHDNDMLIDWLESKSPKKAIKEDPKETNPYKIPGYVKSIYFAYLLMKNKGLFLKKNFTVYGKKLNKKQIESQIMHADKKIQLRIELGQKQEKEQREERRKKQKPISKKPATTSKAIKSSPVVKNVIKSPTTKRTKTSRKTSRVPKK
jgi:hypothetical protein